MRQSIRHFEHVNCVFLNLLNVYLRVLVGLSIFVFAIQVSAQVGISTDGSTPDPDAILDVKSTNRGILIPRMTTTQRNAINGGSPAMGLLVFDNTTASFWYYNGNEWQDLSAIETDHHIADDDDDTKVHVEKSADEDVIRFDLGGTERWVMEGAQLKAMNSGQSVFIGEGAGANDDLDNNNNVFVGYQSGSTNISGSGNTASGYQSLKSNIAGSSNTASGYQALYSNKTGINNTATGYQALQSNITGYFNTANGYQALNLNDGGGANTATGYQVLYANTLGAHNTASGYRGLYSNTTGEFNTASGNRVLYNNTTGEYNTATGAQALYSNTTGINNTATGSLALYSNTTGLYNAAHGYQTLFANTTGADNTANGYQALYANTTGNSNTANGKDALYSNTTGINNTASAAQALYSNTTGNLNTASGYQALYSNTAGFVNTASGAQALYSNSTGTNNSASGYSALYSNTTGAYNTASGYNALYFNTSGNSNTALGYSTFSVGSSYVNSTGLGFDAEPDASNTIRLGNDAVATIGGIVAWTNMSDGRFKTNVNENVAGLDFIMQLRPVTYHLDMDAIARFNRTPDSLRLIGSEELKAKELQSGFIAQEVEAAAKAVGYDFHGVDKPKNETSHYGLRYAEFVVPLVKAMQEQQELIDLQQDRLTNQQILNEEQKQINRDLQEQINVLTKLVEKS